ncbi:MAG: hypothetical protein ACRD1G_05700, partial [Acidimicrobiales bacterium]
MPGQEVAARVRLHVRGLRLPDEAAVERWIVDGRISV